ncbi:MAG: helix-turn-helix domain-containing protein [Bdellovibrionales bacterium]|nr:helix-turn-helix domain-containing protein [Bdellovibrionales bacterium]
MNFQVTKSSQPTKSIQANKPVKAKRSKTSLSKKSTQSKVKKEACGRKTLSGKLFDNLITVEELAVIFRLAPQTIRNWVAQRKLPYVKIGKRNWFLRGSMQEWLNRKEKPQWR